MQLCHFPNYEALYGTFSPSPFAIADRADRDVRTRGSRCQNARFAIVLLLPLGYLSFLSIIIKILMSYCLVHEQHLTAIKHDKKKSYFNCNQSILSHQGFVCLLIAIENLLKLKHLFDISLVQDNCNQANQCYCCPIFDCTLSHSIKE